MRTDYDAGGLHVLQRQSHANTLLRQICNHLRIVDGISQGRYGFNLRRLESQLYGVANTETKSGKRTDYNSDAESLDIPIVILINENSASASEVFTGALKDYGKATVVGKKSYGKGIVQSVLPFYDGSGMSLTVAKYYTPNGTCIHGIGIEPDVEVDMPDEYKDMYASMVEHDKDTQLQKAIEIIKEK